MAARLVGADPTGKPVVHPLRWPGSWNFKATPVMARIFAYNEAAEIHLVDAVTALSEAIELAGWEIVELPQSGPPQAAIELLQSATDTLQILMRITMNGSVWVTPTGTQQGGQTTAATSGTHGQRNRPSSTRPSRTPHGNASARPSRAQSPPIPSAQARSSISPHRPGGNGRKAKGTIGTHRHRSMSIRLKH